MLRRKLIKKGLAKVMALTLAVSMAMPGTALAAAAQPPLDEATVEDVYEEDAAAEAVTIDETAEEAPALTDEGSEAEAPAEEAPADAEKEDAVEAAEDDAEPAEAEADEDPADAEDESSPADTEDDSAVNGDNAAEEAPADTEEVPAEEDVTDPAAQEDAAEPAAASPEMNEVTDVTINSDEYTVYLGLTGRKTYQMDIEVTYDTSTSYETNEPVFFKSSNENVLTVDSNGMVTAVGTGYAYVSVYTKTEYGENNWTSQSFSVVEAMYSVKFDLNGGKLADGLEAADANDYKMYHEGTSVAEGKYVYLDTSYWDGSESKPSVVRDGGYRFDGWTETKDGTETIRYSYSPTKDVTLYAKWTRVYTVTFDPNAGTWASSYYEEEYGNGYLAEKDKAFYLPDNYDLKRDGYILKGWTETKDGTTVLPDKYTATKDITLYAKWVKSYKVTFNAGAGYFGTDTSAKTKVLEIEAGKDIGNYLDYSSYTPRNGSKVFLGWYKNSALSDPAKKSDTITKDTTYYAKYETKVYKITVTNLKGASYTNHATGEYIYGDKSTAESYSYYISQGDAIGSLSADKDGENARFFYDQDCKTKPHYSRYVPTGNTTVYAKWNTEVTITWDADGGQNYSGKSTGTVDCKKNLMCENLPTELTKAGYYFVGWYDTADSSKKILPASHVFKANTTVKAKWATAIKITFKSGGGIFNPEGDPVIYIKAKTPVGEKMDFSIKREGYTLKGWKNSVTGKVVTAMYEEKPDKATTYTAVWEKETTATTVNVTLIAGDGSLYDYDNDRYVTKLVLKVAKNSTLGDGRFYYDLEHDEPYKKLDVDGWSLTKNGTALAASYKFTKDVTLYPLWAKNVRLTVALVTNGGAVNNRPSNTPRTYTTVKDGTIKLPNASNMEKEGFTFVGWYTDPAFKTKVSTPDAYKVTKSCYLYAKWKEGEPSTLGKTTRGDMFNLANNVKVTWKEVPGATYYKVYREGITDKSETQKDPVIVTTGLVGWDAQPGLTNGHAYRYRIVASTTGKGDSSGDSQLSYSKVMYRLKTVVIRSVKNTAAGTVTVTYDKTTSGDSYVLQYCERQDMVGAKTKVVLGASNTSYKITGLKKGKTYYISIRVRKKVDGIDYYTTFGVAKKVTITK